MFIKAGLKDKEFFLHKPDLPVRQSMQLGCPCGQHKQWATRNVPAVFYTK